MLNIHLKKNFSAVPVIVLSLPVDTGVVVGVLVYLGPLSPALLPDDHSLVVGARGQDVPEPDQ